MYKIIVWHNDSVSGTHQSVLFSAKTINKIMSNFERYLNNAPMRSFNECNVIQLHHVEKGLIAHFPANCRKPKETMQKGGRYVYA
jgi:hypothetical protein